MTNGGRVTTGPLTALANGSAFIAGGVTTYKTSKTPSRNSYVFAGQGEIVPNGSGTGTGTITIYPGRSGGR